MRRRDKPKDDKKKQLSPRRPSAKLAGPRQPPIELDDTVFRGGPSAPRIKNPAGEVGHPGAHDQQMTTSEFLGEILPIPQMPATLSLTQIHETLAALLVPYARKLESEMHPKIGFCLKAKNARTGRETHFGAVQVLGDSVAYHLFPLYGHEDLLKNISAELHSRMRSKTCFHFATLHAGLVSELAELTHACFERFLSDGVL